MTDCVSCNTAPEPCNCQPSQTCVQTPRNCTTCPQNICISSHPAPSNQSGIGNKSIGLGGTIGGAVGGAAGGLVMLGLGFLFYKRFRSNHRNTPSSHKFNHHPYNAKQALSKNNFLHHQLRPNFLRSTKTHPSPPSNGHRLSTNQNNRTHSVIYLPTATQSPNSASPSPSPHQQPLQSCLTSSHQINHENRLNKRSSAHLMDVLDSNHHLISENKSNQLARPNSDDDPFSDSKRGSLPPSVNSDSPLDPATTQIKDDLFISPFSQQSNIDIIPIAYIPPNSKSLSIGDVEDRDGLGNPSPTSAPTQVPNSPMDRRIGQPLDMLDPVPSPSLGSALRSSFLGNSGLLTPPLSGHSHHHNNSALGSKPVRPPRAPDLDLRLPPAAASTSSAPSSTSPRAKTPQPSTTPQSHHNQDPSLSSGNNSSAGHISQFSVDSSVVATPGVSRFSDSYRSSQPVSMSIPVSPLMTRHNIGSTDGMPAGSRLSLDSSSHHYYHQGRRPGSAFSDATTHDSHLSSILDPAMIVTPVTLVRTASGRQAAVQRVALGGQEKARVVRLANNNNGCKAGGQLIATSLTTGHLPMRTVNSPQETLSLSPSTPGIGRSTDHQARLSKLSTVGTVGYTPKDKGDYSTGQPSPLSSSIGSFEFESGTELGMMENPFADTAAIEPNRTAETGRPKIKLTEEEEGKGKESRRKKDEDPSRLSKTWSVKSNISKKRMTSHSNRTSFGATSSINESFMEDEDEVQFARVLGRSEHDANPQQRQLPFKSIGRDRTISLSSIITEEAQNSTTIIPPLPNQHLSSPIADLPGPFKPFAGQKPTIRSSFIEDPNRLSGVSSHSGYGSVLEGIPFNIGFNSENDELFGIESEDRLSRISSVDDDPLALEFAGQGHE